MADLLNSDDASIDSAGGGIAQRLSQRLNRYWRVVATGISFLLFGFGGLVLRIVIFPILNLMILERNARVRVSRYVIRRAFRGFVEVMRCLGVLRYEVRGLERLERQGLLILANHPTLIDTIFLMAFVKQADCIVKSQLWRNPFTGGPVRAADYISNDDSVELIDDCIASLKAGNNLIIFPEGTRTAENGAISLKRGAANVAVRSMANVTPVVIHCAPPTLHKGKKWWQVPNVIAHFKIEVKQDIEIAEIVAEAGNESLAARRLTAYLQDYFKNEISINI
ncbi:lysophospholipid acyltransferase family protein [Glaciimonas soli]|uniref:1-acyl-sn-glycerol-3-phosphate acyltransferase n=1 Tax=Glaciimonas soli TaxID=2590999 RepID=A0A843YNJ2_9BURK|nr:lysophospholipid acyltransferase family protein [Glaciimonas soli]MQQ99353.1 1-acyl-sn-glycerol-3-phosphate acyltransferase [Glaciimonas soli]